MINRCNAILRYPRPTEVKDFKSDLTAKNYGAGSHPHNMASDIFLDHLPITSQHRQQMTPIIHEVLHGLCKSYSGKQKQIAPSILTLTQSLCLSTIASSSARMASLTFITFFTCFLQ